MVHLQETERILDGSAVASVTLNGSQPEIYERAGLVGEYNLLGGAFYWVSFGVYFFFFFAHDEYFNSPPIHPF